jgi:hypothetical protein
MKKPNKNKEGKIVKNVVKAEKELAKAVKSEAKSVRFQVKKLSDEIKKDAGQLTEKVGQVAEKVKKNLNSGVLVAEAVAGITLVATLGAYSLYLVRHGNKKLDFNKMKINVLREVRKATEEAKKVGKMEVKKIEEKARKMAGRR